MVSAVMTTMVSAKMSASETKSDARSTAIIIRLWSIVSLRSIVAVEAAGAEKPSGPHDHQDNTSQTKRSGSESLLDQVRSKMHGPQPQRVADNTHG